MYCESCMLNGKNSIFPSGSFNPDYYILGDVTTQNELDANQVFSITTPAGQYLNNVCQSIGMTQDNTRFFKVVRCAPDYYNNSEDLPARDSCHHFAFMDIYKTRPKIIVALGREVSRVLLGDRATAISSIRGRIYDVVIEDQTFKVMPTFSPNFIVNNPSQSEQFVNDLMHAMSYVKGDLVDIEQKELLYATNYEEFHKYYEERLKDKQIVSFDLETNARDARSQDARMVGFSMAPDGTSGIYVVRESLEYQMPSEDWEKITELAKSILNEKTALIHNTMYEVPFTYNEWGVYINNFIDTLIKARLLLGGKIGAGLKDRCILDLGYPDWDHDLDEYKSGFTTLMSKLRPTSSGSSRWDFTHMKNRGLASLYDEYANEIEQGRELDKRCAECYNALNKIRNVVLKYYTTDTDYSIIIELIGDEIAALIDAGYNGPFSYGFIPMRIITKYGAMDSVGTQDLNVYLDKKIKEFSETLNIDLNNGYEYMRRHYVSGTWMEMNGLYWNDDVANEEKEWYEDQCLKASLAMIDSPYLDDLLFKEQKWILNDYIVENHLDIVRQVLGDFYIMKSGIKLASTGELIRYKNILERLGPSFADQYRSVLLSLVRQKARTHTHYKELKYIFNPASPKQSMKDTLNSVFITPEIQIAHFMNKLNVMLDDGDFSLEKYPPSDRPLFRVLLDCRKYNKYVDEYNQKLEDSEEDLEIIDRLSSMEEQLNISEDDDQSDEGSSASKKVKLTSADTFRRFAATLAETRIQSRELVMSASESMNYRLDSISEPNIIELNTYYCITGVDVDDQSTWTERYKFLVNFRMWKKCNKMITTYIDGSKVGRGSVWMVDKKGLQSGELLTRRKRLYDGNVHEDECCLMQPAYKVCTANSYRWQAGMHTIPAESSIKNIYTSRYEGGCIAAPDFSQMELRTMAGASHCTAMIEAFRSGADIHMQNAMKIFKKPAEEITAAERRYSKMACTLGSTMIKLADGTVKSIEDIYKSGKKDFYAYSFDTESKKVVPGHVVNVMLTKYTKDIMEIELDNGAVIKVTPDHRFLTTTGIYKLASELAEGDKLESLFYRVPTKGAYSAAQCRGRNYEQIRNVRHEHYRADRWGSGTHIRYGKWEMTHQEFYKYFNNCELESGYNIDHDDMNSLNNDPINLKKLGQVANIQKCWNKSDQDRFGLLAQAQNVVAAMLREGLELTPSNYDQMMEHLYESRGHLYWSAVSRYYTMTDVAKSVASVAGFRDIDEHRYEDPIKGKFKLSEIACRTVKSVKHAQLDEEIPVYDMSVERHHNYAIDLGDNSGIFTHNSFMILYGGDYRNFGEEFLDGDIKLAKYIYDSFYESYPEVAQYIEDKHKEMKEHGKVTTLMDMFLNISPDDDVCRGDEGKALRIAQNAPIQSAASMIAGCCLYEIMKFIREHNFKSKVILFVHDSIEVDIHPAEMLQLASQIVPMMNKFPNEQFNMPVKADLVLGKSIGQEVTIEEIHCNEDFTEGEMICEADEDNFDALINEWKKVYKSVTWEDIDEPKTKYKSWSGLWISKLAIQKGYGVNYRVVHRKVKVII